MAPFRPRNWVLPLSLIVVLVAVGLGNYLLFHVLAELVAVVIAVLLCAVAWHTYPFSRNAFLMVLAAGYFWVGMIDLVHALVYKGMGVFPITSANPASQLWLVARFGQALLLAVAPFFAGRTVHRVPVFVAFGGAVAVAVTLVFTGHFPEAYIDGLGPTAFNIVSEWAIIAVLAAALVHLRFRRTGIGDGTAILLALSIGLTMAAELCFTLQAGLYGGVTEVGHVLKLLAFWLLFEAIIRTTLVEPYRQMEARVAERTADLTREVDRRRRAEMAIGASETRLRAILEHSPTSVSLKGLDGRYLLVNSEFERLYGVSRIEALGRRAGDVVGAAAARLVQENHAAVVRTSEAQHFEFETLVPDRGCRYLVAVSFPVFGDGGVLMAVGTVSTDITDHKKTEEQLRQAQKMQALGDLAGGLAHELNNMLQPVVALSGVLAEHITDGQDRHAVDMILKAGLRARDLVAQVQTFSRQDSLAKAEIDIGEALQTSLGLLRSTVPSSVDLAIDVEPGIAVVWADSGQLGTVLLNLVSNAVDALPQRTGRIAVALDAVFIDEERAAAVAGLKPGRHACLSVADDGHGMDAATAARVFDPFFSTKEVGRGTGLGLSVVHGIVAAHGGAIRVTSVPGAGARFDVFLPLMESPFDDRPWDRAVRPGA